ncbi:MAG: leucyl aminopeptidase [Hyphomicrobiaceae bacterium]
MPVNLQIEFQPIDAALQATTAVLVGKGGKLGSQAKELDKASAGQLTRAMEASTFKGQAKSALSLIAPPGLDIDRLFLIGAGDKDEAVEQDWAMIGGYAVGQLGQSMHSAAGIVIDIDGLSAVKLADAAAAVAMGAMLRSYRFDKYQTKKSENGDDNGPGPSPDPKLTKLVVQTADPDKAKRAFVRAEAIARGVVLARDLVNEPANILGPLEFAERCEGLREAGAEVEILDAEQLEEIGMHALLAVAQGSAQPARVAIMQWHGAKSKRAKPLCFIGKGVCFDTGGISMKPAGGMEDMKGDMGGAACVTGLLAALAQRKAAVNAIGIVGLVENMPSGTAQRPGDIISSLSGQTIEVLNTDAEGRLVLADLLTYAQQRFRPRFMINLATLTGAIIVALGRDHAGMFSNDDRLASDLSDCGEAVGEKVWRMPLGKAYDKLINSQNADMKNIGGRLGGAITAAQFLQRFVKSTPWVHLDVAGTAMASEKTDISRTWASGWGVRLLDRLVSEKYERS